MEGVTTKDKKYYIKGIFAQADVNNRNGRNYPKKVMESAFNQYSKLVSEQRALGELNHPKHPNVNLERASHMIESLQWDGGNVIGRARVLTHMPMGLIVKGLIEEGVKFGVSTRGLGSLVEKNGTDIVQNDYMLTAIDVVSDPSAPDAFVNGIMENADWVYNADSKSWIIAEQIKKQMNKMSVKQIVESQARAFETFLQSLK